MVDNKNNDFNILNNNNNNNNNIDIENKIMPNSKYYENVFLEGLLGKSIICPISHQPFDDPVIDISCGCSYERIEIYKWLQENNVSPISREIINLNNLINNVSLRNIIDNLRKKYKELRGNSVNEIIDDVKEQSINININENLDFEHNIININVNIQDPRNYIMYRLKKVFTEMKLRGKDEFLIIGRTLEKILGCRYHYDIHPISNVPFVSSDTRKAHYSNQIVIYAIHESIRLSLTPRDMIHLHGLDEDNESLFERYKLYEFNDRKLTEINTLENVIVPTSAGFMRILVHVGKTMVPSANIFILRTLNHLTYKGQNIIYWLNNHLHQ